MNCFVTEIIVDLTPGLDV